MRADDDDEGPDARISFTRGLSRWSASVPPRSRGPARAARADVPGIAVGDSARFLAEAAKLALELLARGRVLPTLERREDHWLARWEPVTIDPGDSARVRLLAESMPPLLCAEAGSSEHGRAPDAVAADVLGALVDACARRFLSGRFAGADGAGPARPSRPGSRDDGRRPGRAGGRAGARGARRAARRVASGDGALRRAPDVPDLLSAVGARGAHRAAGGGARTIESGEAAPEPWRVEILLQAKDDPSVLVPAEDVWSSNGAGLRVLGRQIEDPQERLLGGLGHALRLWPELEPALQEPAPTGVELDADAAFRFLRDAVPALEQAGFGVLAPAWWSKRLRLKLRAEPMKEWEPGSGLFSLDGLCAYEWRIAVGDATLSLAELHELAALKLPLVMSRGQWIVLRPEDVEAAVRFFEGREESGEAPAAELLRESLALGGGNDDCRRPRSRARDG